jgi:hypothetical protein
MTSGQFDNLVPKNGHKLMVLLICRVSKPGIEGHRKKGQQDERSLEDQEAMLRDLLQKRVHTPFGVRVIATLGR